jgi:hypothetical protein
MFISSPSKSALYGFVTATLNLNVPFFMIFAIWHIIEHRWRDGCLLNSTASPSIMCLWTTSPFSRLMVFRSTCLSVINAVSAFQYFSTRKGVWTVLYQHRRKSRFMSLTVTGFVRFIAIFMGTPCCL